MTTDTYAVQAIPFAREPEPWRAFVGSNVLSPGNFPLPTSTSEIARQAKELHAEWCARVEHVQAVEQAAKDALEAVHTIHRAYLAEIERAASIGEVSTLDTQLIAKRNAAEADANPAIHELRRQAALDLASTAQDRYHDHIRENALKLVGELRPEAERVAAEIRKVNAAAQAQLTPLAERSDRLRDAVTELIGRVEPFRAEDIPSDPAIPPLPSAASLARYAAL